MFNTETGQTFARKLVCISRTAKTARNELRVIKKLCDGTHKNIVKVFTYGELPNSQYIFIDMEFCSKNLDEYIQLSRMASPLPPVAANMRADEIWSISEQIADALAFIHSHHEIHRDLKPQNGSVSFLELLMTSPIPAP
jgi:serine/threonine protein kinase